MARSLEHWRWKFQANPVGRLYLRLAVTPAGALVGQYTGIPVRVAWGEKTVIFTQIVDVMVDRRFRLGLKRPGLFAVLARHYIADYLASGRVSVGYGFPTAEALRVGQRTAGYTPLHPVERLVLDLRRTPWDPSRNHATPTWAGYVRGIGRRLWGTEPLQIDQVDRFGAEADQLWEQVHRELPVATIRDARYLNWRYVDCPDVTYLCLAARERPNGDLRGIAVLRLGVDDQPIACLVDWLVPNQPSSVGQALLMHCEARARQSGMRELQAWFPQHAAPYRLLLERHYQPEPVQYSLVALTKIPGISLAWVDTRWYYTMGDSDIY